MGILEHLAEAAGKLRSAEILAMIHSKDSNVVAQVLRAQEEVSEAIRAVRREMEGRRGK